MGVVYKAEDLKLKRPVALKFLPLEFAGDSKSKKRFIQEAQAASALDHVNICTVYEIDETQDGQLFMASAYYQGKTLKKKIMHGPLDMNQAIDIAIQVAQGLGKAHQTGIVHRDIKPANLMITSDDTVKILDFGLAKLAGQTKLAEPKAVLGTLAYMSPEQAHGEEVDQRSDVWSLGVVLYQMLTGQLPFKGEYEQAVIYSILNEEPEPISAMHPDVPPDLERIVSKAMAKQPEQRYQNAADMLVDLKALKKGIDEGSLTSALGGQSESAANNLPPRLTTFVGREQQMADILRLLADSRLITLTGPAGCGKTRLAVEASRELLQQFRDGVWLIELAPLRDPSLVPQTVSITVGSRERPNQSVTETLIHDLNAKKMLLVLDNCEHLISACAKLTDKLLRSCPGLHILATSREGMGITSEVVYHVPPLGVPRPEANLSQEELQNTEAVRLFIERAKAVYAGFDLTQENSSAIVQICRRLDGIPLALELGAARVSALPVEEIARRLNDRFGLLSSGSEDRLPHHQTLRALIDWSYDHLPDVEQKLFCRLSVFAGSWGIDAVESVCVGSGIQKNEVLDLHCRLVERSLVEMETELGPGSGMGRYRMLGIVQEYARQRLSEEGTQEVQSRYRDYFLALAEEAARQLTGPDQASWISRLEVEHDNLRAALEACSGSASGTELALRMAGALGRYWYARGLWTEGRSLLLEILARPDAGKPTAGRARALDWAGWLSYWQGDFHQAAQLVKESLPIWQQVGDGLGMAEALNNLGAVAEAEGNYAEAIEYHEKSLAIRRGQKDRRAIGVSLHNLGETHLKLGNYARARMAYQESLALFRECGHKMGIADSLSSLGIVAERQGDYAQARRYHEEALKNRRDRQDPMGISESLHNLAELAAKQGEYAEALGCYAQSLALRQKLGDRMNIADSLEGLGILAAARKEHIRAARLLGAARSLREQINAPTSPAKQKKIDTTLSLVRSQLGEPAFAQEWDKGRGLSLEQATHYALKRGA